MRIHELKTWSKFYSEVKSGKKKFEIRKNDRDFKVGDLLLLKEYSEYNDSYTHDETLVSVTYILNEHPFVPEGFVCMSIEKVEIQKVSP